MGKNYTTKNLALFIALVLGGCSPSPDKGISNYNFESSNTYTIREHLIQMTPTYDIIGADNRKVGEIERDFLTLTRNSEIRAGANKVGNIETKIISLGYDMAIKDQEGQVLNTIDHKLMASLMNFGGFYMEIKDPTNQKVGTLKQDPFALFTQGNWKYFDIKDVNGNTIAKIEYTAMIPDTYKVNNLSGKIDNRTLVGIVSILDQIEDEINDSDSKNRKN